MSFMKSFGVFCAIVGGFFGISGLAALLSGKTIF